MLQERKATYPQAKWRVNGYRPGVEEPGMMYNVQIATRETHATLHTGSMAYNATNGGSQKAAWESDTAIVPKIPGNAGGGKGGTQVGPV